MKSDHLLDPAKIFFTSKFEQIGARPEGVGYNSEMLKYLALSSLSDCLIHNDIFP